MRIGCWMILGCGSRLQKVERSFWNTENRSFWNTEKSVILEHRKSVILEHKMVILEHTTVIFDSTSLNIVSLNTENRSFWNTKQLFWNTPRSFSTAPHSTSSLFPLPRGFQGEKSPGPMELLHILHLGFAFRLYIGYKIPRPHGTTSHTSFRVSILGLHRL